MKKTTLTYLITLIYLLFSNELLSQNDSLVLKGLKKSSTYGLTISSEIDYFNEDFTPLPFENLSNDFVASHAFDSYVDPYGLTKVVVFRPLASEESKSVDYGAEGRRLIGSHAPDFYAVDIEGNLHTLEKLKGKIIVMNFWFINCPGCVAEIPELNHLVDKYQSNEDIVFLAFTRDKGMQLNQFLQKHPFAYQQIPESWSVVMDFKAVASPSHVVIDRDGIIVYHELGSDPKTLNQLENAIKKHL